MLLEKLSTKMSNTRYQTGLNARNVKYGEL